MAWWWRCWWYRRRSRGGVVGSPGSGLGGHRIQVVAAAVGGVGGSPGSGLGGHRIQVVAAAVGGVGRSWELEVGDGMELENELGMVLEVVIGWYLGATLMSGSVPERQFGIILAPRTWLGEAVFRSLIVTGNGVVRATNLVRFGGRFGSRGWPGASKIQLYFFSRAGSRPTNQ
jgi:hypothetical protein